MKILFYKDIRVCIGFKIFNSLFFLIIALISVLSNKISLGIGYMLIVANMFIIMLFSYDENDKSIPNTFTLPVNKIDYVRERYLVGFVSNVINFAILTLFFLIKSNIDKKGFIETQIDTLYFITVVFLLSIIILSIILPFLFIFGAIKALIIIVSSATTVVLLCFFSFKALIGQRIINVVGDFILNNQSFFSKGQIIIYIFILTTLIFIISYFISMRHIRKKDF